MVCGFHAVCAHLLLCLSVNHTHFLAVGFPSLGATSVLHILCAGREHKGITILQQLKRLFTERKNFHRCYEQASSQSKYMPADFLFPNKPIPFCPTLGDSIDSMQAVVFWRGGSSETQVWVPSSLGWPHIDIPWFEPAHLVFDSISHHPSVHGWGSLCIGTKTVLINHIICYGNTQ